jgi:hypothetical protein
LDRGLSVTWYDLPQSGIKRYMNWLHESYLPRLLKKPGVMWAAHYRVEESIKPLSRLRHTCDGSIPDGNSYILLLGGKDAHAFASLTPYKLVGELTARDKQMLAMRRGERRNIFTEEGRAEGPEAKRRDKKGTTAPCIQLGSFNAAWTDEDEVLSWYAHFRLPAMETMPGSIGIRKLASVSGWAKHGILYEFTSLEERARHFRAHEAKDPAMAAWTHELVVRLLHAPGSPNVAQRIWPPPRRAK